MNMTYERINPFTATTIAVTQRKQHLYDESGGVVQEEQGPSLPITETVVEGMVAFMNSFFPDTTRHESITAARPLVDARGAQATSEGFDYGEQRIL